MRRTPLRITNWMMVLIALIFLAPLFVMIMTSFKPEAEVLNPRSIIPSHWTVHNFRYVLKYSEEAPFTRWLLNSVFVSSSVTLLVLVFSSMAAFALTRLRLRGGARMLGAVVVTMMLPAQLFLVPFFEPTCT